MINGFDTIRDANLLELSKPFIYATMYLRPNSRGKMHPTLEQQQTLKYLIALVVKDASSGNDHNVKALGWLNNQLRVVEASNQPQPLQALELTSEAPSSNLLELKALRVLIEAQNLALPTAAFNTPVQHQLALTAHQLDSEIENLEATGHRTGLDHLQRQAIAQYGEYGLLIEELRDAANGKLPALFTALGNLLARYRDLEPQYRDLEAWIWTLESMSNEIKKEIDVQNQELYARRGV